MADDVGLVMFECDQCEYASANADDYQRHVMAHAPAAVAQSSQQQRHLAAGVPDRTMPSQGQFVKQYECKHCPYITRECVSIRRHVMTHLRYHPYHCPLCDVTSIRSKAIKTHLANVHKNFQVSPLLIKGGKEWRWVHGERRLRSG